MDLKTTNTLKKMVDNISMYVNEIIIKAEYNKTYAAAILSIEGKGKYNVKVNNKEYTATSYFNLPVGASVYAIAPNNNIQKLFLLPYKM